MTAAIRIGRWRVWLAGEHGDESRRHARDWLALADRTAAHEPVWHRSKHAVTHRVAIEGGVVYVKCYRRYRYRTDVKDLLRASKARHVFRMSSALAAAGFTVPRVLAAAEERRGRLLYGAWVATAALVGMPLAERLSALASTRSGGEPGERRRSLHAKRRLLAALGTAVGRLHTRGFVPGDLVPANVWTVEAADRPIAFLDHDRTVAISRPARWSRARRNLVQLNRFALGGVVATDRLRVYRAYAAARGWDTRSARRRLPWVISKTRDRRRRIDSRRYAQ